ncbi:hypothetical protein P7C70_g4638, partial [Phenoliferia sp. Uapishka_3]
MATYSSYSPHPYAQYDSSGPIAVPAAPPPSAPVPPLPSQAQAPPFHSQSLPAPSAPPSSQLPPLPLHQSDPFSNSATTSSIRSRGESSPVQSRHREPFGESRGERDTGRDSGERRKSASSSSGTPRRIVDGREETREERRARKDRERAPRQDDNAEESSPSSRRSRHRPSITPRDSLPPSPSSPLEIASLSPPTQTIPDLPSSPPPHANGSASRSHAPSSPPPPIPATAQPTSSKSVLTIALQKAQSAVLLDSANNVPAAIAAYEQSVRLLKDVMVRVEEGSRRERERELREAKNRVGESEEVAERRRVRSERREKMKVDEARRLKVIHDTYEDRIAMLLSMSPPTTASSSNLTPPPSSPSTPTIGLRSTSTPPFTPHSARTQHQTSTSLASISTSSASPAPSSPSQTSPTAFGSHPRTSHLSGFVTSPEEWTSGMGSLALGSIVSSPPSPMDPHLPPPTSQSSGSGSERGRDSLAPSSATAPNMRRRPSVADSVIVEGQESEFNESGDMDYIVHYDREIELDEDREMTPTSSTIHTTTSSPQIPPPTGRLPRLPSFSSSSSTFSPPPLPTEKPKSLKGHSNNNSWSSKHSSGTGTDDEPPVTAKEFGDITWPRDRDEEEVGRLRPPVASGSRAAFVPSHSPSSSASSSSGRNWLGLATSSTSPIRPALALADEGRRGSLQPNPTSTSERPNSRASLNLIRPLPPLPGEKSMARPVGAGHRPSGSTSSRTSSLLVHETTDLGTISQRRKSPQIGYSSRDSEEDEDEGSLKGPEGLWGMPSENEEEDEEAEEPVRMDDDGTTVMGGLRPTSIVIRPASRDSSSNYEFGQNFSGSGANSLGPPAGGGYSSASLPSRLRTFSQPGKRPPLGTYDSAPTPALPRDLQLPGGSGGGSFTGARSVSGPNFLRKGSIPTPTSLYAPSFPSLERNHSHSSQGSVSENGGGGSGPGRQPSSVRTSSYDTVGTPTSANFSSSRFSTVTSSTNTTATNANTPNLAGGGQYFTPPPPQELALTVPIPPLRRPFHLMRQILQSIESGAYVTPRLYVPKQMWSQTGVKLVAVETKVRMLDLLLTGLEGMEKSGEELIRKEGWKATERGREMEVARGFAKELEDLEGLMGGIQSTLAKKLGYGTSGKKTGPTSFSAWSSKLSRSLDRVTNGRSLDSPATYIEGITRVFRLAQCIDIHLAALASEDYGYETLGKNEKQRIEKGLRRASDFFGQVICQFILRDLGIFLDKYVKRGGAWVGGE